MKPIIFFILLLFLTSCLVPEFEAPEQKQIIEEQEYVEPVEISGELQLPTRTITFEDQGKQAYYGYDDHDNLVYIKNDQGQGHQHVFKISISILYR